MTNQGETAIEGTGDKAMEGASEEAGQERLRDLPPAARRALAEAAERRRKAQEAEVGRPAEVDGRKGPEPTRYGDWEKDGIASDF